MKTFSTRNDFFFFSSAEKHLSCNDVSVCVCNAYKVTFSDVNENWLVMEFRNLE